MLVSTVGRPVDAVLTEATALGNVLYQLRSGDEVPDFETGRRLVMGRFSLTAYEPKTSPRGRHFGNGFGNSMADQ
jgi:hypothetical protein